MSSAFPALDGTVVFVTPRLRCRRWREDDLETIHAVYADPVGARWVGDGEPIEWADSKRWLGVTAANYARDGYGMFAVETRDGSKVVGFCGLVHPGGQDDAEIKYAYRRKDWGKGYASEIAPALIDYGHRTFGLDKIIATVAPENAASHRVLEKAGLVFVDVFQDDDGATALYEWHAAARNS